MELLAKQEIIDSINAPDANSIFIDPLLDIEQVGNVTVDLRLGHDFLVSVLTRKPYIAVSDFEDSRPRGIHSYFQETRRDIGDRFILYPNQVVLATTLEYVSLPSNMYVDVLSRSSYTRLGIHINTMVQPGFRGCIPLEMFNHGNNAIELVVGSRLCQIRFFKSETGDDYLAEGVENRKYYGDVRPKTSKVNDDPDMHVLNKIMNLSKST